MKFSSPRFLPTNVPDSITWAEFILEDSPQWSARPQRSAPCLVDEITGKQVTLKELQETTLALAKSLYHRYNLNDRDVVLIAAPNCLDFFPALWAPMYLGSVVALSNPALTYDELLHQATLCKATCIIAYPTSLRTVVQVAKSASISSERIIVMGEGISEGFTTLKGLIADGRYLPAFPRFRLKAGSAKTTTAYLSFSSGTTGKPKAVMISHYGLIANVVQMYMHCTETAPPSGGWRADDVVFGALPMFHVAGMLLLNTAMYCGMTLLVVEKFNFPRMVEDMEKYKVTHLLLVPPMAILACKHPDKSIFNNVKAIYAGGAPVSKELHQLLNDTFTNAQVGQLYGMTEGTCTFLAIPGDRHRCPVGSAGQPLPGIEVKVCRPDRTLVGIMEPGEICFRSPALALGYLDQEEATRHTYIDGWLHSGDEVVVDKDGEVYIVDRIKELIKVKGFQVAPAELEGILLGHPAVSDSCVIGIPDEYFGEVPKAFVVVSDGSRSEVSKTGGEHIKTSIIDYIKEQVVEYKRLRGGVQFVSEIPKTASGKILRRFIRDKARNDVKASTTTRAKL